MKNFAEVAPWDKSIQTIDPKKYDVTFIAEELDVLKRIKKLEQRIQQLENPNRKFCPHCGEMLP